MGIDVKSGCGGSVIEEPQDDSTWSSIDRRILTLWFYLSVIALACVMPVIWFPAIRWNDLIFLFLLFLLGFSGIKYYHRFMDGEEKQFKINTIMQISTRADEENLIEVIMAELSLSQIPLFSIFLRSLGYRQYRDSGSGRLLINVQTSRQHIGIILSLEALKYKDELDEIIRNNVT